MSEPFLGEVKLFGFNYAPSGYAQCDGQILSTDQNPALFAILGTAFGGDGRDTFALPDMRGRTPVHEGNGVTWGQLGGTERQTLAVAQMPVHQHQLQGASVSGDSPIPAANVLGAFNNGYADGNTDPGTLVALDAAAVAVTGTDAGHENMQPFLAINFCIALQGTFPS